MIEHIHLLIFIQTKKLIFDSKYKNYVFLIIFELISLKKDMASMHIIMNSSSDQFRDLKLAMS